MSRRRRLVAGLSTGLGIAVISFAALHPGAVPVAEAKTARSDDLGLPSTPEGKAHPEIPDTEAATCLTCHDSLGQPKVPHAPVAEGMCAACHEFSSSADQTKVALAGGAAAGNAAPLCVSCHDTVGAAVQKKYAHAAAASGDCTMCHAPHGADRPRLLRNAELGLCTTCHDGVGEAVRREHVHAPAAAGECTSCHDPHGSDRARLLKSAELELCTTCHDAVGEQARLAHPHAPVTASCTACHDPHGSANAATLRAAVNDLCLGCHLAAVSTQPAPPTTLFGRELSSAMVPLASPERLVRLDRTKTSGHPVAGHPVAGPKDPTDPARPFTCLSCHVPHASDGPALQRFVTEDASEACVKCH